MRRIPLPSGHETIIDDEDYELVSKFSWHRTKDGYAATGSARSLLRLYDTPREMLNNEDSV